MKTRHSKEEEFFFFFFSIDFFEHSAVSGTFKSINPCTVVPSVWWPRIGFFFKASSLQTDWRPRPGRVHAWREFSLAGAGFSALSTRNKLLEAGQQLRASERGSEKSRLREKLRHP